MDSREAFWSAAHALLDAWTLPLRIATPDERVAAYTRCARVATDVVIPWDTEVRYRYAALLLDRLAADEQIAVPAAVDVLAFFGQYAEKGLVRHLRNWIYRCAVRLLGHDAETDRRIADALPATVWVAAP